MGQTVARKIAVLDITTTVLILTITGIAAESATRAKITMTPQRGDRVGHAAIHQVVSP
jgi:hypothetical protein